jgi:hypothetical protein
MPSPTPHRGARIAPIMTGCLITNARILDGTGRALSAGAVRVIMKDGALHKAP